MQILISKCKDCNWEGPIRQTKNLLYSTQGYYLVTCPACNGVITKLKWYDDGFVS